MLKLVILEIPCRDLLQDLVAKCVNFGYERYFELQIMKTCSMICNDLWPLKTNVMMYSTA